MAQIPSVILNNGVRIPQVGFGVFLVPPDETRSAVATALEVGYRHIDTATLYRNEAAVGQAISESSIAREDIFVTTKCWNSDQGYDSALAAFDASMDRLGFDYLDLYLIHWPAPALDRYSDTWGALERLYAGQRVRAIGVSNFHPLHLQRLLDEHEVTPAVNQIELHPWLQQVELRDFHAEHGIVTEAWSPLARGGDNLSDETLLAIADKHDVSTAQVILRWHLDLGNVVIPKSVNKHRMASNLDLFAFELDDDDSAQIATLDKGERVGPNPDQFSRS
ncbi:MAG: aldo/keto reductase [Nocardioidaceae bacterium]|nr:aldo/keto reductase [Nocardioidaceae bacterium]